jgi:hypothetical protein
MRKSLFVTPALLAACATTSPPDSTPVHGVTPGLKCAAAGTDNFIGQKRSTRAEAAIKRATKAAVLRWSPPHTMLTMDYREDRVTVWVDEAGKITKLRCG